MYMEELIPNQRPPTVRRQQPNRRNRKTLPGWPFSPVRTPANSPFPPENAHFGDAESSSPTLLQLTLSYTNAARMVAEKSEREVEPGPQTLRCKGNLPNPPDLAKTVVEHQAMDIPLKPLSTQTTTEATTNVPSTPTVQADKDPPVSKTGINLAALASVTSPPTISVWSPALQSPPHPSPIQQHPHQPPLPFHTPPHPQSHPQPPAHALAHPHNPHWLRYPPHPHYGGPQCLPPFDPSGFGTIQVQVPPVILPGPANSGKSPTLLFDIGPSCFLVQMCSVGFQHESSKRVEEDL
ncbi:predicted protein [Phaeodactylum tricornutum CCAP 1055/1]|uniref:Uncharacterized protein n=1 Tax=Phaeodactylum tricornutum (strain CCAP 1055/1) TaxID=556484 RepID=B7FUN9_PHATC|nr:predicted protein [Phaeodactylum tricornutum CCAP 1055/1]EEC50019.1 predicted protein [Phaeodactylum tricornutum CCAP 1055/1]|eukprot:XP_002178354.1 predicted protein [Phaeodactylum tricornutum CCAP 1055/1]